ncbi:MAG: hypothetical protein HZB16_10545 [Armatimonadetes bacterium]|nr:hypothetical protein [Armatimonadota bacterium]
MPGRWEFYDRLGWAVHSQHRGVGPLWLLLLRLAVVAGSVAFLGALLFPVFARQGERGGGSERACPSNLKQIAIGLIQYAQDYDDHLPPVSWRRSSVPWPDTLQPYLKSTQVFVCPQVKAGISYGLNSRFYSVMTPGGLRTAPRLADAPKPVETYLLLESDALLAHPLLEPPQARHPDRRPDRTNVGFLDGHVKQFRRDALQTGYEPWPNGWDARP